MWHDLKIAVHQHSSSKLAELEQINKEEWVQKKCQSKCPKPIQKYQRWLRAVTAVKGLSANYRLTTYR